LLVDDSFDRLCRILIVDDSRLCRKATKEYIRREVDLRDVDESLSKVKILFEECEDGAHAVNIVMKDGKFDIICMDNIMTTMGGIVATKNIRQLGFTGKIIAITGNVMKEDVDEFLSAGADYVLAKPLNRAEMAELFCKIIEK